FFIYYFFFFQAEDGIRDFHVTGVQTCALPILGTNGKNALIRPDTPATMLPNDLPSPVKAVGATVARSLKNDVQNGPPSAFVAAPSSPPRASEVPFTSGDSFGDRKSVV